MYCVKCKRKTKDLQVGSGVAKNGTGMKKGKCADCGCKKCQFVKKNKSQHGGALSNTMLQRAVRVGQHLQNLPNPGIGEQMIIENLQEIVNDHQSYDDEQTQDANEYINEMYVRYIGADSSYG